MSNLRLSLLISVSCLALSAGHSDVKFESEIYFRRLLRKDDFLLEFLDLSIEKEEEKIQDLKNTLQIMKEDVDPPENPEVYKEDINRAFKLIKRLAYDWRTITNYVSFNVTEDVIRSMYNRLNSEFKDLPNPDIGLAIETLNRLRQFSDVSYAEFASGNLGRVKLNSTLNSNDCYVIGKHQIDAGEILDGTNWLIEGYNRAGNTEDIFKTNQKTMKELATVYFKTGHYKEVAKDLEDLIDKEELMDDRPFRFQEELTALKDAKEAATKKTKTEEGAKPTPEDNSAYEYAYSQLPPMKSLFQSSLGLDGKDSDIPITPETQKLIDELKGKSEAELEAMIGKTIAAQGASGSDDGNDAVSQKFIEELMGKSEEELDAMAGQTIRFD